MLFSDCNVPTVIPEGIFCHLLVILGAQDDAICYAARQVIITLLETSKTGSVKVMVPTLGVSVHSLVWSRVMGLLPSERENGGTSIASVLAVWLKLAACSKGDELQAPLRKDIYWILLQKILLRGSDQQRKLGLAIMRMSLDAIQDPRETPVLGIRKEQIENDKNFYQRYCTLFETIIIGRYLNQIEDCIPELNKISADDSPVHPSWIFLLFTPAFDSALQDKNRRIIAQWVMDRPELLASLSRRQNISTGAGEPSLLSLIVNPFLGWAAQGTHFTSSLLRVNRRIVSEHGAALSSFLSALMNGLEEDEASELMHQIVNTYLIQIPPPNPTGLAFILHGIYQSAAYRPYIITDRHVELFRQLQLPAKVSLPPSALRVVRILAQRIGQLATNISQVPKDASQMSLESPHSDSTQETQESDHGLPIHPKIELASPREDLQPKPFQGFLRSLESTDYRFLRGEGLQSVCSSVYNLLKTNSSDQEEEGVALDRILQLIWERLEIEDFPRATCHIFPKLIFHENCLRHGMRHPEFADLVSSWAEGLLDLCRTRIATLPSLMRSVREAFFKHPEAFQAFHLDSFLYKFVSDPPRIVLDFSYEESMEYLLEPAGKGRDGSPATSRPELSTRYGLGSGFTHESYSLICTFDMFNHLCALNDSACYDLFDRIITPWTNQSTKDATIPAKWKRTSQLQAAFILAESVFSQETSKQYFEPLLRLLSIEAMPRFRILVEWILVRFLHHTPDMHDDFLRAFEGASNDFHNPKYTSSLVRAAVAIAQLPVASEDFSSRLMVLLMAMSMYTSVAVRYASQWAILFLFDNAESRGWDTITGNPILKNTAAYLHKLKTETAVPGRVPPMRVVEDRSLSAVVEGSFIDAQPSEQPIATRLDFQLLWEEDAKSGLDTSRLSATLPLGNPELRPPVKLPKKKQREAVQAAEAGATAAAPLQTKGYTIENILDDSKTSCRNSDLILVASLIEYPVNLGGLSRCAEVFGAGSLYIPSLSVVADKEFKALSVSSEVHLPIHECPEMGLKQMLAAKKNEGYTIVGIEQTDHSVILGTAEAVLPTKAVFVLGSERYGIPGELMLEMDTFVEIRQLGIVRSLNVQTAAAVVLAEYVRQHR
ncbi:hypothetical protein P152DRAFT_479503 [Eremomyces bilateralis CBS 781.70]|uniref:tRNA/rRNA methyltransferase SpoU type domain-containing protein n=1 Tax=Eremomyces bilateralis CBS 781.70 TaxID=1392243 RepID=A0A6G1GC78_9PEZI|nr:uncharacterized protein P152DRAFT_479503 [Eremomyces bilateralis CBS 781.70]KAF1815592.1 hypothetical protein P152DRAFT_479503 [Eremomyces bilateralis CBS 781.70]